MQRDQEALTQATKAARNWRPSNVAELVEKLRVAASVGAANAADHVGARYDDDPDDDQGFLRACVLRMLKAPDTMVLMAFVGPRRAHQSAPVSFDDASRPPLEVQLVRAMLAMLPSNSMWREELVADRRRLFPP